ncbi:GTPase [Candidatus Vidania fulgoroideorum]
MLISNDPIISSSTCYKCRAGISGIRISLCNALLAKNIIYYITNKKTILFPRLAKFSYFYLDGKVIDNGIIIYFPKGNSFTGEIVIEIYTHGNRNLVNSMINGILFRFRNYNLRLPNKGEFLKRSYYNGKISFSEVIRLYSLLSKYPTNTYSSLYDKHISLFYKKLKHITNSFFNIVLYLENYINFNLYDSDIHLLRVFNVLKGLITSFKNIKINNFYVFKESFNVCIVGHENVGKSSIFNILVDKPISIVSGYKGTTRNSICKTLFLSNGLKVNLFDTAGFNCRSNDLDIKVNSNISHTLSSSDLIINVCDIKYFNILPNKSNVINVVNKVDLIRKKVVRPRYLVFTSCRLNIGISFLKSLLNRKLCSYMVFKNHLNSKDTRSLIKLSNIILLLLKRKSNVDLISTLTRKLFYNLKKTLSLNYKKNICDEIFKRFCIGK